MPRFLINERDCHHASEAKVLALVEKLLPTDELIVTKEIGSGYYVTVEEGEVPKSFEEE